MNYFIIKFRDEDGDWFMARPGMWTDRSGDARRFEVKVDAEKFAAEAEVRLNRRTDEWHPHSRVRVIEMRHVRQ